MADVKPVKLGRNTRMSFGGINEVMKMPNLLEMQKASYNWFVGDGLKEVFRDFEVRDAKGNYILTVEDFKFSDKPTYSIVECKEKDTTYSKSFYMKVKLVDKKNNIIYESTLEDKNPNEKENRIMFLEFPIMTDSGTFVINGAERVVISQLVRSPGVYYDFTYDKNGKKLFTSTVIPNRGAWLEYETDQNDVFYVRIDKNKKLPVTTFIRALGVSSNAEIRELFGDDDRIEATLERDPVKNTDEAKLEVFRKLRQGEQPTVEVATNHIDGLFFDPNRYDISRVGRYKYNKKLTLTDRIIGGITAEDIYSPVNGDLIVEAGGKINAELADIIDRSGVKFVNLDVEGKIVKVMSNNMVNAIDFVAEFGITQDELEEIAVNERVRFSVLTEILETCGEKEEILEAMAARVTELIPRHIIIDDIFATINYLNCLGNGLGNTDDIDHLGNRRIRSVGELLQNQFRIGLSRLEKKIRESLNAQNDEEEISLQKLVSTKLIQGAIKDFFGSSPLSQFMDQTNPLAELTHKRRLSALGPGGLSRDRAGFEVRDVHYSHYGRMCPIETPEGPNIGLISYLATFGRINKYGFIEAPFRKIDKETGKVLDEVEYMTADVEDNYCVAQANEPLTEDSFFANDRVTVRYRDEFREVTPDQADYMDVSPKMVFSVATSMIPFLENDDANRALMGSNMQRQAVPLLKPEAPIVGTGMEYKAAIDSGIVVLANNPGVVSKVSAKTVEVLTDDGETEVYELLKYMRSNQGTCINQRPVVSVNDRVEKGDVIADGPATDQGEIALGKNALIGFMTWEGYNYEDAVLLNEKVVREDVFTSIHIEEHDTEARDTKLGPEEITRDIPNVGEDALANLDENGIIRVGAEVHSGDILVGKVTPKGETESTPEERLLRAIFGEKAREVRDTSLRLPHGEYGTVVNVDVYTKEKNPDILTNGVNKLVRVYIAQKRKISVGDKMAGRHGNKGVVSRILPPEDMPFLPDGTPLDIVLNPLGVPSRMNIGQVLEVHLGYAAKALGYKVMTPVFDGAHEEDIRKMLAEANLSTDGKTWVTDGRTGRRFDNPVTVGIMYYLKLHHLVDDKIHARSTGPYSLVTQQPLGGKAQFGGQRFGEMEVWALEAYGAAYTLQEILTVKSDDVKGRENTYQAIVKGYNIPKPGVPESFKVLVKELQSLSLDVRVLDNENNEIDLRQNFGSRNFPGISEDVIQAFNEEIEAKSMGVEDNDTGNLTSYENEAQAEAASVAILTQGTSDDWDSQDTDE